MTPKSTLRRQLAERIRQIPPAERASDSAKACDRLKQQSSWRDARTVLLYAPLPEELDVWPLIGVALTEGKVVALPRFDPAIGRYSACQVQDLAVDIREGEFGIREPCERCIAVPLNRLDLTLVPGVGFDLLGRRLGRGKGFYDQLLVDVRGTTCGVAFDQQIVADIPVEPHDVHLNCILTPTRWILP